MTFTTDVAIIGGGVIGCSIAYALSKAGVKVTLLERAEIAAEASSAAAGLLAPAEVLLGPAAVAHLFLASWSMTPALIQEIEQVSGVQVEYQRTGALHLVADEEERQRLAKYAEVWHAQGEDATWLEGTALHQYEPLLNPKFDAALYVPHAASIRPRLMTTAYAEAARKLGATLIEHTEVIGIQRSANTITALQTAQGETIACSRLVIATGAWSAPLGEWLGLSLPIYPMRGQILAIKQPVPQLKYTLFGHNLYMVPKIDQTVVVGATVEQAGFDKSMTAGGVHWLLSTALQLVPDLASCAIDKIWTGLRPWSQDSYPILGKVPGWENVIVATGHGAGGFELSAITGATIAELIVSGQTPLLIQAFGVERFLASKGIIVLG